MQIVLPVILSLSLISPLIGRHNKWKDLSNNSVQENMHRLSEHSLNRFSYNVHSQFCEDGIIEEIFKRLNISKGFFVEFGGADGIWLSNARNLYEKGWKGAFIESKSQDMELLRSNYAGDDEMHLLNYFVTWKPDDKRGLLFDEIKDKHFPEQEIDFLSIDIDGGDYYILKSLKCRPKVIAIETNLYWHPLFNKEVPEAISVNNRQQPVQVMIDQARSMGYEPVAMTINLFFVRRDLYEPFKDTPDDALTIWRDAFRANPDKPHHLYYREVDPDILRLEGFELNQTHPITADF